MKILRKKRRGLSLIELVVALSLVSIILMIVGPFFISNYKTLNKTSNQIDFQREAKSIMNYFTKSAMESSNILNVSNVRKKDSNNLEDNKVNSKDGYLKVTFNNEDNSRETEFRFEDGSLYMKTNDQKETKIGDFVKEINLTALPNGNSFKNAKSIKIEILLDNKNNKSYKVSDILTFRNKN